MFEKPNKYPGRQFFWEAIEEVLRIAINTVKWSPQPCASKNVLKSVSTITSNGKGETVTVIVCDNAEGTLLPPACIMNEKTKKKEFKMACSTNCNSVEMLGYGNGFDVDAESQVPLTSAVSQIARYSNH